MPLAILTALAVTRNSPLLLGNNILKLDRIRFTGLNTSALFLTFNMTIWQSTNESDFARWHVPFNLFPLLLIVKFCRYLMSVNYKHDIIFIIVSKAKWQSSSYYSSSHYVAIYIYSYIAVAMDYYACIIQFEHVESNTQYCT